MVTKEASARSLALDILGQVLGDGAYANLALQQSLATSSLSAKDKGLVTELVYGTLTRKIQLEWYLSHLIADRDQLEPWVYHLLLLSLYQICYLERIPDHAVVNEAVTLAKKRGHNRGAEKLVNAVLRRILRDGVADVTTIKRKNKRLSIEYSLPVWLVKKLLEQYGESRAQAIMASLLEKSKASIRVSKGQDLARIAQETDSQVSRLSPVGLVKTSGHFAASQLFQKGQITIQDESSQLVAPTLRLTGTERVLDACAAPGGKTCHMASYLTTGEVLALDLHEHKLALIRENAERLGVADRVKTQQMDASTVHQHFAPDSFDKILVDAPCSGMGLLRRKPDIRFRKEGSDFAQLADIQLAILDSVCQTLRKGGIITYSTCTLFQEENQGVLQRFLEKHSNFELVPLEHPQKDIVVDGCLVITPELYGSDGFFIGQLKRIN
ncbi:16S rRNA (cytosine(967)-C(5))-methyltransferase RsmB [Streptococcus sp. DD12]|uniref:16S rRNA (cytosine(967)-C(5))-methyltransferase RsmB n=1 Tax=Streptococcus sp. DD12 TaxID=1777880 RepID=UPI000798C55C|nr:Ribosomal RNA small subunit methyltransferase B [Streptococcus sp. DD12]